MTLDELRIKIDEVDARIVELLNERYATVIEIGKLKHSNMNAVYVPEREKIVFDKVAAMNHGPMTQETLKSIYCEIMSGALSLEHPLQIICLGTAGSSTHQAALSKFGHSVTYLSGAGVDTVFSEVAAGHADYGCVPIESSLDGVVNHTLEAFITSDLKICAEILMSTKNDPSSGCAAGNTVCSSRFLILGKQIPKPTGNDKMSLCFTLENRVGSLLDALQPFKDEGLPITMIESRPSQLKIGECYFFIDVLGHQEDPAAVKALGKLKLITRMMRILGSYPNGK